MTGTKLWAIGLMILTTTLTSSAQILYKYGSGRLPEIITNWPLLGGLAIYALGAALLIISFKGGEVSVLYPLLATSYLWVTLASWLVLGETIGALNIIGVTIIIIGITFVGYGSKGSNLLPPEAP